MLKQHLTHLILEMIGEDKRDYKLDDGNIITAVTMPYLREKVPELVEKITFPCLNCTKECNKGFCSEICVYMFTKAYIQGKNEWNKILQDKDLMNKIKKDI